MKTILISAIAALGIASLNAEVLMQDNFNYANGDLTTVSSGAWTAHSGSGSKAIQVVNGSIVLDQSGGSAEDASRGFAVRGAEDTTYASFTFNLPSGQTVNPDGSGLYFAHFMDSGFGFRGRFGVLSPQSGGDFAVAINADSSNLGDGAIWATDLSFDTEYTAVISFDALTGTSNLWINPFDQSSPNVSMTGANTGTLLEAFAFRQSNDYTGSQVIGSVIVGETFGDVVPEPSTYAVIAGAVVLGLAVYRRRR